jgi:hypothetical protein
LIGAAVVSLCVGLYLRFWQPAEFCRFGFVCSVASGIIVIVRPVGSFFWGLHSVLFGSFRWPCCYQFGVSLRTLRGFLSSLVVGEVAAF